MIPTRRVSIVSESANERRLDPLVRIVRQRQDDPISIRDLAKRLRVRQRDVLTECEDQDLCINVAIGIQGAGYAEHDNIGDYTVEDLSFNANTKPRGDHER